MTNHPIAGTSRTSLLITYVTQRIPPLDNPMSTAYEFVVDVSQQESLKTPQCMAVAYDALAYHLGVACVEDKEFNKSYRTHHTDKLLTSM